ncbi:MAG TPA: hypothetical protein VGM91_24385 [Conexibacter sp.]
MVRLPDRSQLLPTWQAMSPARRAWEVLGAPLGWGLVCGLVLGASGGLYLLCAVISTVGGINAGAQHTRYRDALLRGVSGGLLLGVAILAGFALSGAEDPKVDLPDPRLALLALTTIPSLPLSAIGCWLGRALRGVARQRR